MKEATSIPGGPRRSYPWKTLFDGRVWELTEGEDFGRVATMRVRIYRQARSRGLKVTVRVRGDRIFLQALRPATPEEASTDPKLRGWYTPTQLAELLSLGPQGPARVVAAIRAGQLAADRIEGRYRIPVSLDLAQAQAVLKASKSLDTRQDT